MAALERRQRDPVFLSAGTATVLLDTDFVIRAATWAYTAATDRRIDSLLAVNVFDAFPDNPETPEEPSTRRLAEAVDEALRSSRPQRLPPMRYDIPDPRRPGRFVEKRWVISCAPLLDGREVIGCAVSGHDLSVVEDRLLQGLSGHPEAMDHYLALVEEHGRLAAEVAGLREAQRTRSTIEQAKGIVMADRRCSPEQAFAVLRKLSMDTNVRLVDVAAALVYQAQHPQTGPGVQPRVSRGRPGTLAHKPTLPGRSAMTTTPEEGTQPLSDSDIETTSLTDTAGTVDADGTDGDSTDTADGDSSDGDSTDTTDGDSTDGGDADGTDA